MQFLDGWSAFQVKSSTKILVKLIKKSDSTAAWAPEPGPLKLIAINTGAGMMNLQKDVSENGSGR